MPKKPSNNVIRRLPRYLRKLDELNEAGVTRISSFDLGQQLGLTPSQIRQDFSNFGPFGQQGYGYNVVSLRTQIEGILGVDRGFKAIIIGVGNIGKALMDNFKFSAWGFNLVAGFDIKEGLVGTEFKGVPIYHQSTLPEYLAANHIDAVVLCVPSTVAVATAKLVIDCGVEAIWNFTNVEITEPNSPTIVENVHFSDSLLSMSYFITARYAERAEKAAKEAAKAAKAIENNG